MNIFDLPVHPAADVFPMLDNDELSDLAADIKANGLQHPVVVGEVDGTQMLIDGRNRLAACKMAGVEPAVKQLNGHDPESLILSENIMRRHMNKGQQAAAIAKMFPRKSQGKKTSEFNSEVSRRYINMARTALEFAPGELDEVLLGNMSLPDAYKVAIDNEENPPKPEPTREERMAALKEASADYWAMVPDQLSLEAAEAAHKADLDEARKIRAGKIESWCNLLGMAINGVSSFAYSDALNELSAWVDDDDFNSEIDKRIRGGLDGMLEIKERFADGLLKIEAFLNKLEKQ